MLLGQPLSNRDTLSPVELCQNRPPTPPQNGEPIPSLQSRPMCGSLVDCHHSLIPWEQTQFCLQTWQNFCCKLKLHKLSPLCLFPFYKLFYVSTVISGQYILLIWWEWNFISGVFFPQNYNVSKIMRKTSVKSQMSGILQKNGLLKTVKPKRSLRRRDS